MWLADSQGCDEARLRLDHAGESVGPVDDAVMIPVVEPWTELVSRNSATFLAFCGFLPIQKSRIVSEGAGSRIEAVVLDTGEEAFATLTRFASEAAIPAASLTAIGAFERATVGWFDFATKIIRRPNYSVFRSYGITR
jgi:hypothetical protein